MTQVPYDDTWSILSNARQLLPNIDSSHIKSGNINISHLRAYLTFIDDRENDITIARTFILFMMGHLWFQTANDTVPLGYLTAETDLDSTTQYDWGSAILASLYHGLNATVTTGGAITRFFQLLTYWFYEYCGVGHPLVMEEVMFWAYLCLRAWERRNMRKINDQATNLFILGRYHIDHRTIGTITWEPWLESEVSEIEDVLTAKLLSRKRMPLQVPNKNCEYNLGDRCWRQLEGEERKTYTLYWAEQTSKVGHMLTDSQRMGNINMFEPIVLRAGIIAVVITSASVHSLSQDFSLPGEAKEPDPGWHMEWIGRQSARDAQRFKELENELVIAHKKIEDLQLRRGRDIGVVPLPPRGGVRTRQRESSPQTRGGDLGSIRIDFTLRCFIRIDLGSIRLDFALRCFNPLEIRDLCLGNFDNRLGNFDNRLIQVPYDNAWSILPNVRQLLLNINSSHIKGGNVNILHLKTYFSIAADWEDDMTMACAFILFMMGHLWFQTANDTPPLGYLAAVADLDEAAQYDWGSAILVFLYHGLNTAVTTGGAYWFYEYCGVGHPIVKEDVKFLAYPRLRAWERGSRRKANDQATNLFILGKYHIDHYTIEMITWEPWLESAVSEIKDILTAKLLSRKRMPLQVPNGNCKFYLGDRCWRQLTGKARIPLDPSLSMLPHIRPAALHEMRQADSLTVSSLWRARGADPGWHMAWIGRREMFLIHHLRDPPPMPLSYGAEELWHLTHGIRRLTRAQSAQDAQSLHQLTDELATAHRHIDSIDHQLYANIRPTAEKRV
ncbi:hypothetical protein GIB67_037310 [Kingdonia uniflora]|uniref:Aminotransferase-like plant mobile domain-containing protein n=1 Tax=Kingdonia uniflora TaxID=39325 RepID=A0A7J7MSD0_9MAGN|nr:hypothetical protein GIB67_037310 [Kingdonia uniflora]